MLDKVFSYSTDEEYFSGDFASHEEAAREGFAEAPDYDLIFTGENADTFPAIIKAIDHLSDNILERMSERAHELAGEVANYWPHATVEQKDDLDNRIKTAVVEWMAAHDKKPKFWSVKDVRPHLREDYQDVD